MKRFAILLFAFALTLAACKKTVEGETNKFESNKQSLRELLSLYPGFSKPLNEQLAQGEKLWADAQNISGEEEKIAKMAEANSALTGGFISKLKGIDRDLKSLQDRVSEMNRVATDPADRQTANVTADMANNTINDVNRKLRFGAQDVFGANSVLDRMDQDIQRSTKDCKRIIDDVKKKQQADKTNSTTTTDDGGAAKTKTESTWTCAYCGKKNKSDAHDCAGCGAQH